MEREARRGLPIAVAYIGIRVPPGIDGVAVRRIRRIDRAGAFEAVFSDPDENDSLKAVQVATLPDAQHGALALDGIAVTADQEIEHGHLGTLTFTPAAGYKGSATFTFKVLDQSAEASAAATATITVTDRNDGPIAPGSIPDQWATQGVPFTYTAPADLFTDADDDPLEWSAEVRVSGDAQGSSVAAALPDWLTFGKTTRTFQGTAAATDLGSTTIRVIATDPEEAFAYVEFKLTVQPPVQVSVTGPAQPVAEGTQAAFTVALSRAASADVTVRWATADGEAGPPLRWTLWGQGHRQGFGGEPEAEASIQGDLTTAWLGLEASPAGAPWLAGLAVSRSLHGGADYTVEGGDQEGQTGRMDASFTALYPYVRFQPAAGTEVTALLGAGLGEAVHDRDGAERETGDLTLLLGAVGLRQALSVPEGWLELAVRGDGGVAGLMTGPGGQAMHDLVAVAANARLGLEAAARLPLAGGELRPFVEAAGRYDAGDDVTGAGLEVAGGLRYAVPSFELEARGRLLALHTATAYGEHGLSVTARVGPGAGGHGLSLALSPRWGAPTGAAEALWRDEMPAADRPAPESTAGALDGSIAHGIALADTGVLTPFAEVGVTDDSHRVRVGTRIGIEPDDGFRSLTVELGAERSETGFGAPDYRFGFEIGVRVVFADASSLILLAKCAVLRDYCQRVDLQVPHEVIDEVASAPLVLRYADAALVAGLVEEGSVRAVKVVSGRSLPLALGRGEAAAIRLLLQADADVLLSDDGRAIRTCRIMGLSFTTSPRVVVDLYREGVIRLPKARTALETLAVAGRYAREVIAAALVALLEEQEDDQANDHSPSLRMS